jgi:hypothetical protein
MTVGEREGNPQILLDDQDRRTALAYILQRADDLLYDQRRETFGWLVEHEQRWVEQERTRNRQHLLLATRELRAAEFRALLETREKFKHLVERPQSPLAAQDFRNSCRNSGKGRAVPERPPVDPPSLADQSGGHRHEYRSGS